MCILPKSMLIYMFKQAPIQLQLNSSPRRSNGNQRRNLHCVLVLYEQTTVGRPCLHVLHVCVLIEMQYLNLVHLLKCKVVTSTAIPGGPDENLYLSWFNPSQQLSTTEPLTHFPPTQSYGEDNQKKK